MTIFRNSKHILLQCTNLSVSFTCSGCLLGPLEPLTSRQAQYCLVKSRGVGNLHSYTLDMNYVSNKDELCIKYLKAATMESEDSIYR